MDFKAAYDAVLSAQADAQQIAQEIEALFEAGQVDEALEKREEFTKAKEKMEQLQALYDDMAGTVNTDVKKRFIPAGKRKEEQEQAEEKKTMARAEFDKLEPQAQFDFVLADGIVVDEVSNG